MVSTLWSRIYIPNRRIKEVERGGKATSQHPVRESYWKSLCSTEVWAELVRTPCHKSDLEMQSLGDNKHHVTKTRRRKLRENCLLPQIHHKKFLKIKASGTRDNVRQGALHRWAETCGSRSCFHQRKGNCYYGRFLLNKWPPAGRMAVSPALLAFLTAQKLLLIIAWSRQLNFNSKMWQK